MSVSVDLHGPSLGERFGSVIRELREARGWSQEELAGLAELNRSYMGEIERAQATASLTTALKLARALGLPLSAVIQRCERGADAVDAADAGAALAPALVAIAG